jgi:hypothetical protein
MACDYYIGVTIITDESVVSMIEKKTFLKNFNLENYVH